MREAVHFGRYAPRLACMLAGLLAAASPVFVGGAEPMARSSPAVNSANPLPVILLTGFEPFGPGRPANPSWEGVKPLDGTVWQGHRLVCRQLKVVWGEPMRQLPRWIDELKPVAVFSFGQGGEFTLETIAHNARAPIADNESRLPTASTIVADGPASFSATIDAKAIQAALKRQGQEVKLSQRAGAYLCEETLYSLELLRSQREAPLDVGFCHVPPLGASTAQGKVTAELITQFVQRFLAAWLEGRRPQPVLHGTTEVLKQSTTPARDASIETETATAEREDEVRRLIDRYFKSWSNKDLMRYGQCFMPQAAIQLIDADRGLTTMPLAPFLKSQHEAHRQAKNPLVETPEKVVIRFDAQLAHALVYWKLVDGDRVEYGYDHFTLMRHEGNWRIANLVFYAENPPEKPGR